MFYYATELPNYPVKCSLIIATTSSNKLAMRNPALTDNQFRTGFSH